MVLSRDEDNSLLTSLASITQRRHNMELIAFSAAQTTTQPTDASDEVNAAGLGTLLWITVLAVVFFILLAAAGLSLVGRRTRG